MKFWKITDSHIVLQCKTSISLYKNCITISFRLMINEVFENYRLLLKQSQTEILESNNFQLSLHTV